MAYVTRDSQLARLFEAATDDEAVEIERCAIRAGLLWACGCGWIGEETDTVCDSCETSRNFEPDPAKGCGEREGNDPDGYRCTRTAGHDGDHEAHGPEGNWITAWSASK